MKIIRKIRNTISLIREIILIMKAFIEGKLSDRSWRNLAQSLTLKPPIVDVKK